MQHSKSQNFVATSVVDMKLFYACFVALITTSFGFILRAIMLPEWGKQFNLTQTQLGEIAGVGSGHLQSVSLVLKKEMVPEPGYQNINL